MVAFRLGVRGPISLTRASFAAFSKRGTSASKSKAGSHRQLLDAGLKSRPTRASGYTNPEPLSQWPRLMSGHSHFGPRKISCPSFWRRGSPVSGIL